MLCGQYIKDHIKWLIYKRSHYYYCYYYY